jgi:hypothetical protein
MLPAPTLLFGSNALFGLQGRRTVASRLDLSENGKLPPITPDGTKLTYACIISFMVDWHWIISQLVKKGFAFDAGMKEAELRAAESEFAFDFPPDLREFLSLALPAWEKCPDWRNGQRDLLHKALNWPLKGICFDIKMSGLWRKAWGKRPEALEDRFEIARRAVESAPRLIPIYSHRYIPTRPLLEGNPVFSVYQTDIICYGVNLPVYLLAEFRFADELPWSFSEDERHIEFWSDIVDGIDIFNDNHPMD